MRPALASNFNITESAFLKKKINNYLIIIYQVNLNSVAEWGIPHVQQFWVASNLNTLLPPFGISLHVHLQEDGDIAQQKRGDIYKDHQVQPEERRPWDEDYAYRWKLEEPE